jgi:hypothetical protein
MSLRHGPARRPARTIASEGSPPGLAQSGVSPAAKGIA